MQSKTMLEDFELNGIWWLPDSEQDKYSGRLNFANEEIIRLELIGQFPSAPEITDTREPLFRTGLIYGLSKDGDKYTLLECIRVQNTILKSHGFYVSSYTSAFLVIGKHVQNFDARDYVESKLTFPGLEVASAFQWFDVDRENQSLKWQKPKTTDAWVRRLDAHVSIDFDFTISGLRATTAVSHHQAHIKIKPKKPWSLDSHWRTASKMQTLLTLTYGFPTVCRTLELQSVDNSKVLVYCAQAKAATNKNPELSEMVLPILCLKKRDRARFLNRWFRARPEIMASAELFCGTLFQHGIYTRLEFVNHVQTLESFHRAVCKSKGRYMDAQAYKPIADVLMNAIPADVSSSHRSKLKNMIKFGYEKSQRKRLEELFDSMPVEVQVFFAVNGKDFVDKVVGTRNRYTHYDPTDTTAFFSDNELAICNLGLRLMIDFLFLRYFGIPEKLIFYSFERVQIGRIYSKMRSW